MPPVVSALAFYRFFADLGLLDSFAWVILAHTLLALLPELGQRPGKAIAALCGLAPINRDSGAWRGKRCIGGGRADVRKALYMAAVTASRSTMPPTSRNTFSRFSNPGISTRTRSRPSSESSAAIAVPPLPAPTTA